MTGLARCCLFVAVGSIAAGGLACVRADSAAGAPAAPPGTSAPGAVAAPSSTPTASDAATAPSQTIIGVARDAKHGPSVVQDDGHQVYVSGASAWPKELEGHRVVVEGRLEQRHGPSCVRDLEPCQGIVGDYWVFVVVRYRAE